MSGAIVAAEMGPATTTSPLAYAKARVARREDERRILGAPAATVEGLPRSLPPVELSTACTEAAGGGVLKRAAQVESGLDDSAAGACAAGRSPR